MMLVGAWWPPRGPYARASSECQSAHRHAPRRGEWVASSRRCFDGGSLPWRRPIHDGGAPQWIPIHGARPSSRMRSAPLRRSDFVFETLIDDSSSTMFTQSASATESVTLVRGD